jgi:hypothetical protein
MKNFIRVVFRTVGRWIFWSYDRKSWQYDVLCLILILALIFIPIKGPQATALKKSEMADKSSLFFRSEDLSSLVIIFYSSKFLLLDKKNEIANLISAVRQLTKV